MLGIDAGARWRDQSVSILPGDALLLYTDGLTEARSEAGEEFGEERLASALRSRAALPSDALVASLVEEVAGSVDAIALTSGVADSIEEEVEYV